MLTLRKHGSGFTLIELVIAFALLGILVTLAVPAFQHWIQNAQIRNGAEGILNGLQHARGEAVRRNMNIQFQLGTQSGWTITPASDATNIIASRVAEEGSNNAVVTVTPAGSDRITFNGMGWITNNGDSSPAITSVDITSATMAGNSEIRPLRVVIFTGGVPKMCDPSPALAAGDPRICP